MKGRCGLYFFFFAVMLLAQFPIAAQQVARLQCEGKEAPMGIDKTNPRLGWEVQSDKKNVLQTGYHILVASSREKLDRNEGDSWNSGKVNSSASIQVAYAGKKLQSRQPYYWKVKIYTNIGESDWSAPASWSMGLVNSSEWKARWIGYDQPFPWDKVSQWSRLSARYLRKNFKTEKTVKRAVVYIAGLGLYELYINGKKIGNQVLAPAPTDYRKSVLYNTHDVTNALQKDANAIGVVVGNGRYFTMRQDYKPKKINNFGFPKLLLQLEIEYADGSRQWINSDESWKLNGDGPIRTNNEYDGEEYDATREWKGWATAAFNDAAWQQAQLVKAPEGKLTAQLNAPMKVMQSIQPVAITAISNNRYILDMGQNFAGWLQLKARGKAGDTIQLRFAESLQPNGELYVANLRDAKVTDKYIMKGGEEETWHPSFVYHGFRFVEITGYPGIPSLASFEGQLVFDDMATSGQLQTSDSIINKIHRNAWWGIASNYKGMPVDCPQRNERQPWLGDRTTGSWGESFLFNNAGLYAKWMNDIAEAQTAAGAIPDVAPAFWNYYSDNITWPGTYLFVANMLYRQHGDKETVIRHYPSMKKWMQYMKDKYMTNYILTKDKYGDWCVPPESLELIRSKDSLRTTKGELLSTAYYYYLLGLMQDFAGIAGKTADIQEYKNLAGKIKAAFHRKFYNVLGNGYDNNTVTANMLPLYFGITPDSLTTKVFNTISTTINKNNNHISTGVVGTQWLMRGLTRYGRPDLAFTLASNKTYPSWGYMTENGATTIWELWNGNTANPQMNSQNHVMLLGDLLIWMYENLAGIQSDANEIAFKKIIMRPSFIDKLDSVKASYQSPYGSIASSWKKVTNTVSWSVTIPANTTAVLYFPVTTQNDVKEIQATADRARFIKMEKGYAVFETGSGNYSFEFLLSTSDK